MKAGAPGFRAADFALVRDIALRFPGTAESVSHEGTPSVKVRGKLMCRLHESGDFIPVHMDFALRDAWLDRYPECLSLPGHFLRYPYICLATGCTNRRLLTELLEASWRGLASRRQLEAWEAERRAED